MPESRSGRRRLHSRRAVLAAAAVGLGTALTASLSACSSSGDVSSEGVTLTFSWWGNDDRAERTKKAVALFEQEHPGITPPPEYWEIWR
ncbi:hypothetical protein [Streptomyces tendae]|uniref:hypothetical protein n=1 Tax=Streptomyces tendae TaxID=1932 RepID=UPI0013309B15